MYSLWQTKLNMIIPMLHFLWCKIEKFYASERRNPKRNQNKTDVLRGISRHLCTLLQVPSKPSYKI